MQVFKNVAVDDSFAKLNCYQHCQLFLHQLNFQNFTFPLHLSVLQHLSVALSHPFYIVVFQSVTLHAAPKLNHRHNKQKIYAFFINKHGQVYSGKTRYACSMNKKEQVLVNLDQIKDDNPLNSLQFKIFEM